MRQIIATAAVLLALLQSGCHSRYRDKGDQVLCEKYIHKYGLEVAPDEWAERGQHGEVVTLRKDGVTVTSSYVSGVLDGEVSYSYPHSSAIELKEFYERGERIGEKHYDRAGMARRSIRYLGDGEREMTAWYEGGEPQSVERWREKSLVEGIYYAADQTIESRVDGGFGLAVRRDLKGNLTSHERFEESCRVLVTDFYPNGVPRSITTEQDGVVCGQKRGFYEDGSPSYREERKEGKRSGICERYAGGVIVSRTPYLNGAKEGVEELYRDGEILESCITWKNGVRHGPCDHYLEGKLISREWFYQDRPVSQTEFALHSRYKPHTRD